MKYNRSRKSVKSSKGYLTPKKALLKARRHNLRKFVRKVISEKAETKVAHISTGNSLVLFNSGINSSADMLQVIPNIAQGTNDSNRIGNQLNAQYLKLSGYVRLAINTENIEERSTANVMVRLMVLSMKNRNGIYADALGGSANLSSLLKKGGTTSAFTGVLGDIYAPINTDFFTVHADRRMVLSQNLIAQPGSAGISTVALDTSKIVKFFKLNIKCRNKKLVYDSFAASGLQPVNWAPFLVLGYSFLDGSSPDTLSTSVGLNYISDFGFEDV